MAGEKGVRYEVVKDAEVYKLLKKKDEIITELRAMQAKIDKLAEKGNVLGGKVQKIKDKSIPKMEKHADKIKLKRNLEYGCPNCQWETITSFQVEGDDVTVQIVDAMDAEKERILVAEEEKKKKAKDDKGSDTDKK